MYARVNVIEMQPGKLDEGATFWEETMVPILNQQPGFQGTLMLGDRTADRCILMSLWDTEANCRAWTTRDTAEEQNAQAASLVVSTTREDYEVLVWQQP